MLFLARLSQSQRIWISQHDLTRGDQAIIHHMSFGYHGHIVTWSYGSTAQYCPINEGRCGWMVQVLRTACEGVRERVGYKVAPASEIICTLMYVYMYLYNITIPLILYI